jgi:hypothetical protein
MATDSARDHVKTRLPARFVFLPTNLPAERIARRLVSVPYYGDQVESNPI